MGSQGKAKPVRQGTKPAKAKVEAELPVTRKSPKDESSRVGDLEKRLAEALGQLQTRNRELVEAQEQQTATSEILRVISGSPRDIQPVLDALVLSAARFCAADDALIQRLEGNVLTVVAHHGPVLAPIGHATPATRETVAGRCVLERRAVHVDDTEAETEEFPEGRRLARELGYRTILSAPLLRKGVPLGAILLRRTEVTPFSDKQIALLQTFADQAVIAIENVRLFTELQEKNHALIQAHAQVTESLEQQTATSEILRVISGSPTDIEPVLHAVAENAARVCGARDALLQGLEGDTLRVWAEYGPLPTIGGENVPLNRATPAGRAIVDRQTIHVADLQAEVDTEFPDIRQLQKRIGTRTVLATPLLREGVPIGVIVMRRLEVRPFSARQIELVKTFADQAVIAIENVRLFNEIKEALEQQTATAEILRVISSSPTDLQPVMDAVAESAARLCEADAVIFRRDGDFIERVANFGSTLSGPLGERLRLMRSHVGGRAMMDGTTLQIPDIQAAKDEFPDAFAVRTGARLRTVLAIPLMAGGTAIGVIQLRRVEVRPFSPKQVELLKTFADQAVIAIENVRLFTELQEKNRALTQAHAQVTETLEQQTATSEILRVISQSQMDLQPVFDTIIKNAVQLCGGMYGTIYRYDGTTIHAVGQHNFTPEQSEEWRRIFPRSVIGYQGPSAKVLRTGVVYHRRDLETEPDPDISPDVLASMRARGVRCILIVPMFRHGEVIGSISLTHREVGAFTDAHVELLKTFADQAVIAVENARLLTELQARTGELTRSVEELTALGEVSRALSSTLDLDVVLQTIVTRASQLAGTDACSVYEYDEAAKVFRLRASSYADPREAETLNPIGRATPIPLGQGVVSRAAALRQPVQVPDIAAEEAYESPIRGPLLQAGYRAILTVPLLLEEHVIGALGVSRKTPGEFAQEIVRLLTTFATQSALAIQNARLFREIEQKSRELEAASRHKSEFLANMSHELRTPLNAIIGFSEVLTERMFGELNEKQEEYLKDIYASGQHLLSLINDILDLSKIEAGRMELELTDFHLPEAISNALTLVRGRAGRRDIALNQAVDQQLGQIRGDERKIKQVLLNLLSNALKFTPEGGRVDVRASVVDGMAQVSVTDTGVGIAPEDQEAVFEEFRQVGTADKKVEGTGLGLTLSRKFIELHGGKIWVKSQVGVGSTFTFTLPLTT
jgi:GAF domain-containing protein